MVSTQIYALSWCYSSKQLLLTINSMGYEGVQTLIPLQIHLVHRVDVHIVTSGMSTGIVQQVFINEH